MARTRIAVIGAGSMARARGRALLATGRADLVAVASRTLAHARACADELGAPVAFDDFTALPACGPDALLVETPHQAHDAIVPWALERGYDLLLGGNLAASVASGERFVRLAATHGRVVECGFDRRYDPAWERLRDLIRGGALGQPIQAFGSALFSPEPSSWYYDQAASGGMPLTHMTYAGLSYIRWILGRPTGVAAVASRVVETAPAARLGGELLGARPLRRRGVRHRRRRVRRGAGPARYAGALRLRARERRPRRGGRRPHALPRGEPEVLSFPRQPSPEVRQAAAFLDAMERRTGQRNPPEDALWDVRLAEAIARAARERRYLEL